MAWEEAAREGCKGVGEAKKSFFTRNGAKQIFVAR